MCTPSDVDWRNPKPSLCEGISHTFETGLYTDVSLKVGPAEFTINAHKYILMVRSEVFARMFNERWTPTEKDPDENRRTLYIPDQSPESVSLFLRYLYTDKFRQDMSVQHALEVLDLAHFYQVPGLIMECAKFLKMQIDEDSCVQIYQRTCLYTELDLSALALDFLKKNICLVAESKQFLHLELNLLTTLLKSDNLLIEELSLFKALLRWGNVEVFLKEGDKPREHHMKLLIPHIRFLLMSPTDFVTEIVPTKVLEDALAFEIICCLNGGRINSGRILEIWSKSRQRVLGEDEVPCFPKDTSCYISDVDCPIAQTLTENSNYPEAQQLVPQFKFRCTSALMIRGLKMYGIKIRHEEETVFQVQFSISSSDQPTTCLPNSRNTSAASDSNRQNSMSSTIQKVRTTSQKFDVLLEKPFKTVANQTYWISASLAIEGFSERHKQYRVSHGLRKLLDDDSTLKMGSEMESISFEISHNEGCQYCSCLNNQKNTYGRLINSYHYSASAGIVHSILFNRIAVAGASDPE